jgi:uncharacterized membrane protein YciS (DUF1049 family)
VSQILAAAPIAFLIGVAVGLVLCSHFHVRVLKRPPSETINGEKPPDE